MKRKKSWNSRLPRKKRKALDNFSFNFLVVGGVVPDLAWRVGGRPLYSWSLPRRRRSVITGRWFLFFLSITWNDQDLKIESSCSFGKKMNSLCYFLCSTLYTRFFYLAEFSVGKENVAHKRGLADKNEEARQGSRQSQAYLAQSYGRVGYPNLWFVFYIGFLSSSAEVLSFWFLDEISFWKNILIFFIQKVCFKAICQHLILMIKWPAWSCKEKKYAKIKRGGEGFIQILLLPLARKKCLCQFLCTGLHDWELIKMVE